MAAPKSTKNSKSEPKRLTRSSDRMILGVCSGVGEYLNVDSTIIRLLWIVVSVITGIFPGLIAYFIAAVVMPDR